MCCKLQSVRSNPNPPLQDKLKLLTFRVIFRIIFGHRGSLSESELQAASQDFGTLLGGITFPLTRTDGLFALTPFGKAMAARQRMRGLILTQMENCRRSAIAASGETDINIYTDIYAFHISMGRIKDVY